MSSTVLFVAKLDYGNLKAVYLQVDMEYDNRKNAAYAILNKLSRDLLRECAPHGGCLTNPDRDLCSILMIINANHVKSSWLIEFLQKERISIKLERDSDPFVVENCLLFSMFYFMERAKWFRMGENFVQEGFLWWKQANLPRIQFKPHCSPNGNVYMKFHAEIIRIYPFEPWILDADERFSDPNSGPITHEIRPRWVWCLPKLGKGQIVRVHRRIPDTSPFETYEQIKSYWKKTYGYELPPEEPEVYYDVLFNNGYTMLYPVYCVLSTVPEAIQIRANSTPLKEALALFLKAFKEASIVVCGNDLAPEEKDCDAVKSYLDVLSLRAVHPSKLKNEEKVCRKDRNDQKKLPPIIRKIYPKIPTGLKRSISASQESSASSSKKSRPGLGISFD